MANKQSANVWNRGVYGSIIRLMHVIGCVQFTYAVYFDIYYVHVPRSVRNVGNNFGGKFKYLTFLNAVRN
jgi:hypothetical protein